MVAFRACLNILTVCFSYQRYGCKKTCTVPVLMETKRTVFTTVVSFSFLSQPWALKRRSVRQNLYSAERVFHFPLPVHNQLHNVTSSLPAQASTRKKQKGAMVPPESGGVETVEEPVEVVGGRSGGGRLARKYAAGGGGEGGGREEGVWGGREEGVWGAGRRGCGGQGGGGVGGREEGVWGAGRRAGGETPWHFLFSLSCLRCV